MKGFLHHLIAISKPTVRRSFRNVQVHWTAFASKSWEDKGRVVGLEGLKVYTITDPDPDVPHV